MAAAEDARELSLALGQAGPRPVIADGSVLPDITTSSGDIHALRELVDVLRHELDTWDRQIQAKDGQLRSKDRQIDQLHSLLKQAHSGSITPALPQETTLRGRFSSGG